MPEPAVIAFWRRCALFFRTGANVLFDTFSDPGRSLSPATTLAGTQSTIGKPARASVVSATERGHLYATGLAADVGKFKAPSLRNVALTAPYMRDGSIATLDEILDHYAAGGRTLSGGPSTGIGSENPNKDKQIRCLSLSAQNREDLLAFLRILTEERLIHDLRFSDPWWVTVRRAGSPCRIDNPPLRLQEHYECQSARKLGNLPRPCLSSLQALQEILRIR